jgi:hypothetical protein
MGIFNLRRFGWRAELTIGLVVALLAVGLISYTVLAGTATPQSAATNYLAAEQRGDAATIWNQTYLDTSSTANVGLSLLTRQALQAQLTASHPTYPGLRVERADLNGRTATVELSFQEQESRPHLTLKLRKDPARTTMGIFPVWQVVVTPALLDFKLPKYTGALAVDGVGIELGAGDHQVAVFPGQHVVSLAASDVFQASSLTLQALNPAPATTAVPLAFQLIPSASSAALAAARVSMQRCGKATSLNPTGCPNNLLGVASGRIRWTLYGDPTAGADVVVDQSLDLVAEGHFQMAVRWSGQGSTSGDYHDAVSGPYRAVMAWDGTRWSVSSYADATGVAPAPRPSASDEVVLKSLRSGFAVCTASHQPSPLDCPASVVALFYSNLRWKANGDQTGGATVAWDGDRSLFVVKGTYSLTASWTESPPFEPVQPKSQTRTGQYTADLFWDGQAIDFITFE